MKFNQIIKKILIGIFVWGASTTLYAAEEVGDMHFMEKMLGNIVLVAGVIMILAAFLTLGYMSRLLMEAQKMQLLAEQGVEALEKVGVKVKREPFWKRLNRKAWNLVPVEKEKDILFDHEYDGIRELDNSLPPWWVATFYVCIVAGVAYFSYYHILDRGLTSTEAYAVEVEEAEKAVEAYLARKADAVDETNVQMLDDEGQIALGGTLFSTNCANCHGQMGEGGVGPNLTDQYWLHGGSIQDVFKTIKYGVPEKGMIAWKSQLRPTDIHKVASYIMQLQGTNPPNAKPAQGDIYEASIGNEEVEEDGRIGMSE